MSHDLDDLIRRWLEGTISESEKNELQEIIETEGESFHELERSVERIAQLNVPENQNKDVAWLKISEKLDLSDYNQTVKGNNLTVQKPNEELFENGKKSRPRVVVWTQRAYFSSVAAAVVLLAAAFWTVLANQGTKVESGNGEQLSVVLPDGSEVQLNAGTTLSYDESSWDDSRIVTLDGQAYFDVEKGSRFDVETENGTTTVLGTQFSVLSRIGQFKVDCIEGKVAVKVGDGVGEQQVLSKGKSTKLLENGLLCEPYDNDAEKVLGWQTGTFYFDQEHLQNVFGTLERQYDVKVDCPQEEGKRKYTGFFANDNLEKSLKLVCVPMGLKYKVDRNKRVVSITH
ncbi:FecR domain-containing protein [Limibacter armeniacum]|uniref:FecR family protein n=1 Tax=Limibacter armeniacum TaxID=466084 RepID=UPI002FE5F273